MLNIQSRRFKGILIAGLIVGLSGCFGSGNTSDGGSSEDIGRGDQFIDNEQTVGSISVSTTASQMSVGQTTGFTVQVLNSRGGVVEGIKVSCDSEDGIAIIEPTTGFEQTDDLGRISGSIGCEAPGSYQFGCRLPIGSNKRQFVKVKCDGPVPAGFSGFPGAGGGGLGGGSGNDGQPDGNTNKSVRILAITFDDGGDTSTKNIDTVRDSDCDSDATTNDPETYSDTIVNVKIANDSSSTLTFKTMSFSVPNAASGGGTYVSPSIALTGTTFDVPPNGKDATFSTIFAYQIGASIGGTTVTSKAFNGSTSNLFSLLGSSVRDVAITVKGFDSEGNSVSVTGKVNLHFADFDRCSAS